MCNLTPQENVLKKVAPDVFEKVRLLEYKYAQLNGRALRAGFLVAGDAVRPAPEGPDHVYYVTSAGHRGGSFGNPYYIIELDANGELKQATCSCPDYFAGVRGLRRGAPRIQGNPKCKHICAVAIVRSLEKDREKASVGQETTTEANPTATRGGTPGPSNSSTPPPASQPERYESASVPSVSRMYAGALRSIQGR